MARRAHSLDTLYNQITDAHPARSRASDGWIGDAAHRSVQSDHNPNADGVVLALDVTHDPANGVDIQQIADAIIKSGDPRIWYIIFNKRIWERGIGWLAYNGDNDHTKHGHFNTVHRSEQYDNPAKWQISKSEEDVATPEQIDDTISVATQVAWGKAPSDAVFANLRPYLKNNFVVGIIQLMRNADQDPGALKNKFPALQKQFEQADASFKQTYAQLQAAEAERDQLKGQLAEQKLLNAGVDPDAEVNILGRALLAVINKLGYKK